MSNKQQMRPTVGYYTQTTIEGPPGTWKQCGAFQRHKMVWHLVKKKLTTENVNNFLGTDNR